LVATLGKVSKLPLPSLKRNLTLAFKILTYAKVCCGFSVFASLKIPLVIQLPKERLSQHNLLDSPL
jgi:hypothetical protein